MNQKKVLILFSRLSDYMLNTFNYYVSNNNVVFHVIKKRPDVKEAPFEFNLTYKNIEFYNQEDFTQETILELAKKINPDLIICSGWSNKKYNFVIESFYKKVDTVLTMDNQWLGNFKQYLGLVYSRVNIVPKFKKIWVPGKPQKKYALKLGFKEENILQGWYVANANNFLRKNPVSTVQKKFVFVGRYIKIKGIIDLCKAFIELQKQQGNDWELHCIGTGTLVDNLPSHPNIKHLGFLQPKQLKGYCKDVGIFVLPSHFEPWGLVVQEFALAGFPLIVSNKVGAGSSLVSDENGTIFPPKDIESLKKAMLAFMNKSDEELVKMSNASISKALEINESKWAEQLTKLLQ